MRDVFGIRNTMHTIGRAALAKAARLSSARGIPDDRNPKLDALPLPSIVIERRAVPDCPHCYGTHVSRLPDAAHMAQLRWFRCQRCSFIWALGPRTASKPALSRSN
jgi:hypothetical protein